MKILNSLVICLALTFMGPSLSFAESYDSEEEVKMESPQPEKAMSEKIQKKKKIVKKAKKKKRYKKRIARKKKNKKKKAKKLIE